MLKYSQTRGIFTLEGNRLGRPWHRLPNMFTRRFDIIESRIGSYFLKKHRSSISLKKIGCKMDVRNKQADLLASPVGNLAFDIDRPLLLTLLNNFYGLETQLENAASGERLPTKTEIRLRNRLALDICQILFSEDALGLPLAIKADNSNICSQWAWQITFQLDDDGKRNFYLLLDNAHTDYILNMLRKTEKPQHTDTHAERQAAQKALVRQVIDTLPLCLNVRVADLTLSVADLTTIKAGDIFPVALPDKFPVFIGQSELFKALIVEDDDKLLLSDIRETLAGKSYD